jgi:hypothetical protein
MGERLHRRTGQGKTKMKAADIALVVVAAAVAAFGFMALGGALPAPEIAAQRVAAMVLTVFILASWRPAQTPVLATFAVAFAIMVVNIQIELAFFMEAEPLQRALMAAVAAAHCVAAVVLARLASPPAEEHAPTLADGSARGTTNWTLRIVAAALVYIVLYVIIGAAAYAYTKPYYDEMAGLALQTPDIATVLTAQAMRGIVYALAALVFALTTPRRGSMLIAMGLFAGLGGIAPLLDNTAWPLELRIAHAIEILFQNALFALIALAILKTRAPKPSPTA